MSSLPAYLLVDHTLVLFKAPTFHHSFCRNLRASLLNVNAVSCEHTGCWRIGIFHYNFQQSFYCGLHTQKHEAILLSEVLLLEVKDLLLDTNAFSASRFYQR
jgi:hypothetical protein